jgi:glycosyltransferase involved in cell wall biosynthesis
MKNEPVLMLLGHDMEKPFLDPRVLKEAKSLTSMGVSVQITCLSDRDHQSSIDRVPITRIKRPFGAKKLLKKKPFLALLLLIVELPLGYLQAIQQVRKAQPKRVHCHDIDTLPIGVAIKILKPQVQLVYDSHELAIGMPFPALIRLMVRGAEAMMLPFVDILVTANSARMRIMEKTYGKILKSKSKFVIENYPEPAQSTPAPAEFDQSRLSNKTIFIYQGPLDPNRGIRQVLQGFCQLSRGDWYLFIVGGHREQVESLRAEFSHENIHFTGFVPNTEVPRYQALADVGIVALLNTCMNNYYCSPNKLYEYMQTGCAILGPNFEDIRAFIVERGIGMVTDFSDPHQIAATIEKMIAAREEVQLMKRRSLEASGEFVWNQNTPVLAQLYAQECQ